MKPRAVLWPGGIEPRKGAAGIDKGIGLSHRVGDGTSAVSWAESPARTGNSTDTDYAERWHAYDRPGRYIVTVSRTGANGVQATAQVKVNVV